MLPAGVHIPGVTDCEVCGASLPGEHEVTCRYAERFPVPAVPLDPLVDPPEDHDAFPF